MKKAISDKDFEKAVFLREREIELKEEIERFKAAAARCQRRDAWKSPSRDVEEIICSWTDIPVTSLEADEAAKLIHMEEILTRRIVGQDAAIIARSPAPSAARASAWPPEPPHGLLHLPRLVGRRKDRGRAAARGVPLRERRSTSSASTCRSTWRSTRSRSSSARLRATSATRKAASSPSGCAAIRTGWSCFDEIEKAHPDIANILLQILEDGILTDSLRQPGRLPQHADHHDRPTSAPSTSPTKDAHGLRRATGTTQTNKEIEDLILKELKREFSPEFINRIDDIIVFHPLGASELARDLPAADRRREHHARCRRTR